MDGSDWDVSQIKKLLLLKSNILDLLWKIWEQLTF